MKNMKKLFTIALLALSMNSAMAGGGLAVGSVSNLARGYVLSSAIGGGLATASIIHGLNLIEKGRPGWGVFFLILEEEGFTTTEDTELLMNADVATKEAFLEIIKSEDLSVNEKEELLKELI